MRVIRVAATAVVLPLCAAVAQDGRTGRAFNPADWYKLTVVSSPAMSPDGSRIAFTVQTANERENKYHREVWVVPVAGGAPARYTSPSAESSNPRWSPDGKYLFFTSNRPGGKGTTWALRMDGPGGEAFQLENYPTVGSTPRDGRFAVWSDADTAQADTSARRDDPFAKMQPLARPPYGAITKPVDPARFDGRHFTDMRFKSNDRGYLASSRDPRRWRPAQIWVQAFDGSAKRRLTNTAYSHRNVAVSPDGRWIAFTADPELRPDSVVELERDSIARLPYDAKRDEADRNDTDIFVMPAGCARDAREERPAGGCGQPRRVARWVGAETELTWSPDSRRLAFIGRPGRSKSSRVYVVDPLPSGAGASVPENLLGTWRHEPDWLEWLPKGTIMFGAQVGGRTALFRLDPATRRPIEVLGGRRVMRGFSYDAAGSKVAYVATSVTRPTELYVADANGANERRLTSFNDRVNAEIAWSDAERFTYTSVGGLEIEGWLMRPYGYQPGRRYPLVLYIHGGPHSQYHEGWFDEFQNLAGAGMFVLYTNPRGSSGYGADFTYATRGRWGDEDYQDLMKAVDIVARRPDVDSTRMGVTGGSYGGFMTAWITTKTNRFKAAQTDRMISNWHSWYGMSDAQGLTEFEFFGKPWDNPRLYDELSPIRYAHRVNTPTLIVQSEEDFRTPMGEAEQWFLALKKRNVPVELVRYPRSTHELSRSGEPWLLVDRLGRLRQWFSHWLASPPAAAAASQ
jgi:dipeptidyl aminopeptidase/acylaminoacyl peptidase